MPDLRQVENDIASLRQGPSPAARERVAQALRDFSGDSDATGKDKMRLIQQGLIVLDYAQGGIGQGVMGKTTAASYAAFLRDNPQTLPGLSPQLRQALAQNGQDMGAGPARPSVPSPATSAFTQAARPQQPQIPAQPEARPTPSASSTPLTPHPSIRHFASGNNGFGVSNAAIEAAWKATVNRDEASPLMLGRPQTAVDGRPLVIIDLGHGARNEAREGKGPGALDQGAHSEHAHDSDGHALDEVSLVDPVGMAFAKELHEKGYAVAFVRNAGEELPILKLRNGERQDLSSRGEFAGNLARITGHQNSILISLHGNIAGSQSASGSIVFHNEKAANPYSTRLANNIAGSFSIDPSKPTTVALDTRSKPGKGLDVLTAFEAQHKDGRGVNAAVLVELGFLSNPGDAKRLEEAARNPQAVARQLANGVIRYDMETRPRQAAELEQTAVGRLQTAFRDANAGHIDVAALSAAEPAGPLQKPANTNIVAAPAYPAA